jgi:hypothetical protein
MTLVLEPQVFNLDACLLWPQLKNYIVSVCGLNFLCQTYTFVIFCSELFLLAKELKLEDTLSTDQITDDRHHLF